jgi:hypothetical protein
MSKYYGNIIENDTIEMTFNTFNSSGASVTVTTFADADIHVHKDGGLTQTNAGATRIINFDGVTGNHLITIVTTDAFYVTGSNYEVRVEGITVDGSLINAFIGSFSIENRFMRGTDGANTVTPPTEAQMNARTIVSDDYVVVGDTIAGVTLVATTTDVTNAVVTDAASRTASKATTSDLEGTNVNIFKIDGNEPASVALRDLVNTGYDSGTNQINGVKLVDVTTENTDMVATAPTVDEIWTKAMSDLAGIPAFNASVLDAINISFMALRNKQTGTSSAQTIANDAGATIATAVLSDAAGTTTKEEYS